MRMPCPLFTRRRKENWFPLAVTRVVAAMVNACMVPLVTVTPVRPGSTLTPE
ncbi:MAG: hypothetical protein LC708_03975 [Actinobacteria bacterium]|nr:hypothetical protein [Actinomycetota bacterium]